MSDEKLLNALVRMRMIAGAEGRPVIETPEHLVGKGPCPHCLHDIWPSGYTFAVRERIDPQNPLAKTPSTGGIVVCGACLQPLWFIEPGRYRSMTRKFLRQLPAITQRFIKSEQELFARLKRAVN